MYARPANFRASCREVRVVPDGKEDGQVKGVNKVQRKTCFFFSDNLTVIY